MKRIIHSFNTASHLSPGLVTMVISYLFIPFFILAVFGCIYIYQNDYIFYFVVLLACFSLLSIIPIVLHKYKKKKDALLIDDGASGDLVKASGDWGEFDNEIWNNINILINERLEAGSDWEDLKDHALEIALESSKAYGRKDLSFSVPELLKMAEEISRRYRKILLMHVPLIENIPCSLYKNGYDYYENSRKILKLISKFYNVYRVCRLTTSSGVINEIKGQILSRVFSGINSTLQYKLKQALLQDVLSVSIDLYSGRFKVDNENLQSSHATIGDRKRMAAPLDPLRVCLIGQVSSGKSSIVNALKKEIVADTSLLPSTNNVSVYKCSLEGVDVLHLIDLPGLNGESKIKQQLMEQATKANVILWVLKADQPARSIDLAFKNQLDDFYLKVENRSKKPPVIIGLLNQIDCLKPIAEWPPAQDLTKSDSPKAHIIHDALNYNRNLLDLKTMIPLSVSQDREHFNLHQVERLLDQHFSEGIAVQLNQRRNEQGKFNVSDQFKRIYQTGKSLFTVVIQPQKAKK